MPTFLNKLMPSWKDSDLVAPQSTVYFVSVIVSQSENYQSMVTVKLFSSPITSGTLTETCLI